MKRKRFALIGTGFWSTYQLSGWSEIDGVECVALCNRTASKAENLGKQFGIERIYTNPGEMLDSEELDFVDVAADISVHERISILALERGIPVICQKPFAPDLAAARRMIDASRINGTALLINENWRWQRQIRAFKDAIVTTMGDSLWRARMTFNSSFPVFDNQPFLKELDEFILMDVGTHLLDACRFLFGEISSLMCRTHKIQPGIAGEDAATLLMTTKSGATVSVEISYASRWSGECFPQTLCIAEGRDCAVELDSDFRIRVTTPAGTTETRHPPTEYPWMNPEYGIVHSSIVDCQRNLLSGIENASLAETNAEDNLKTLQAVRAAYESARQGGLVRPESY